MRRTTTFNDNQKNIDPRQNNALKYWKNQPEPQLKANQNFRDIYFLHTDDTIGSAQPQEDEENEDTNIFETDTTEQTQVPIQKKRNQPKKGQLSSEKTKNEEKKRKIYWKRPKEINKDYAWLLFDQGIEFIDVNQGSVGNCYFISILSALSRYPQIIREKFITQEYNEKGLYKVKLFIEGEWQIIIIDDYFPVEEYEEPENKGYYKFIFCQPQTQQNELWGILLEKAWAKVNGGYKNMSNGFASEAFLALTGFPAEYLYNNLYDPFDIFAKIEDSITLGKITTASTRAGNDNENDNGIAFGHSYSILNAKCHKERNVRLIQLRNPWGYQEWKGKYSNRWKGWDDDKELKNFFQIPENEKDDENGIFWMSDEDYCEYFENTVICHIFRYSYINSFFFEDNKFKSPLVFGIHIEEEGTFSIGGLMKNKRFHRKENEKIIGNRPVFVVLAEYDKDNNIVKLYQQYTFDDDLFLVNELTKGNYLLWLYVMNPSTNFFSLNICSENNYVIKYLGEDKNFELIKHIAVDDFLNNVESKKVYEESLTHVVSNHPSLFKNGKILVYMLINKSKSTMNVNNFSLEGEEIKFKERRDYKFSIEPGQYRAFIGFEEKENEKKEKYTSSYDVNFIDFNFYPKFKTGENFFNSKKMPEDPIFKDIKNKFYIQQLSKYKEERRKPFEHQYIVYNLTEQSTIPGKRREKKRGSENKPDNSQLRVSRRSSLVIIEKNKKNKEIEEQKINEEEKKEEEIKKRYPNQYKFLEEHFKIEKGLRWIVKKIFKDENFLIKIGQVKDSKLNGVGCILIPQLEDELYGNFLNEQPNGYCIHLIQGEIDYEGNYIEGQINGSGIKRIKESNMVGYFDGEFDEGKPHGIGITTFDELIIIRKYNDQGQLIQSRIVTSEEDKEKIQTCFDRRKEGLKKKIYNFECLSVFDSTYEDIDEIFKKYLKEDNDSDNLPIDNQPFTQEDFEKEVFGGIRWIFPEEDVQKKYKSLLNYKESDDKIWTKFEYRISDTYSFYCGQVSKKTGLPEGIGFRIRSIEYPIEIEDIKELGTFKDGDIIFGRVYEGDKEVLGKQKCELLRLLYFGEFKKNNKSKGYNLMNGKGIWVEYGDENSDYSEKWSIAKFNDGLETGYHIKFSVDFDGSINGLWICYSDKYEGKEVNLHKFLIEKNKKNKDEKFKEGTGLTLQEFFKLTTKIYNAYQEGNMETVNDFLKDKSKRAEHFFIKNDMGMIKKIFLSMMDQPFNFKFLLDNEMIINLIKKEMEEYVKIEKLSKLSLSHYEENKTKFTNHEQHLKTIKEFENSNLFEICEILSIYPNNDTQEIFVKKKKKKGTETYIIGSINGEYTGRGCSINQEAENKNERKYSFGYFDNGIPSGYIKIYNPDKTLIFKGIVDQDYNYKHGTKYVLSKQNKLKGTFKDNKLEKFGALCSSDYTWVGQFENGRPKGKGKYYQHHGFIYRMAKYVDNEWQFNSPFKRYYEYLYRNYPITHKLTKLICQFPPNILMENLDWIDTEGEDENYNKYHYIGQAIHKEDYDEFNGVGGRIRKVKLDEEDEDEKEVEIYEVGHWKEGNLCGKGMIYYYLGEDENEEPLVLFRGKFEGGKKIGYGYSAKLNKDKSKIIERYYGSFYNDKKNGYGVEYKEDSIFEGNFYNDLKDGKGFFISKDLSVMYELVYKKGNVIAQNNTQYPQKSYNKTQIRNNYNYMIKQYKTDMEIIMALPISKENLILRVREGNYEDGAYIGEYNKVGQRHGRGILTNLNNGTRYEGNFFCHFQHGKGKLFDADGKLIYEGNFQFGIPMGKGTYYKEDERIVGEFLPDGSAKSLVDGHFDLDADNFSSTNKKKYHGPFYGLKQNGYGLFNNKKVVEYEYGEKKDELPTYEQFAKNKDNSSYITVIVQGIDEEIEEDDDDKDEEDEFVMTKVLGDKFIGLTHENCRVFVNEEIMPFSHHYKLIKNERNSIVFLIKDNKQIDTLESMFTDTKVVEVDLSHFDSSGLVNMALMFSGCDKLTHVNLKNLNTSKVTNMNGLFQQCENLESIDISSFKTSKVCDFDYMFNGCKNLRTLTMNFLDMNSTKRLCCLFQGCWKLSSLELDKFKKTTNITDISFMFAACNSLSSLNFTELDLNKVENMNSLFSDCISLTKVIFGNQYSNVKDMTFMFNNCQKLKQVDLSRFKMENVKKMSNLFKGCCSLISVEHFYKFDTTRVQDMSYLFQGCCALQSPSILENEKLNTSNVKDFSYMFDGCTSLTSINLSKFNFRFSTNMKNMFSNCTNLTSLKLPTELSLHPKRNLNGMFDNCPKLKEETKRIFSNEPNEKEEEEEPNEENEEEEKKTNERKEDTSEKEEEHNENEENENI